MTEHEFERGDVFITDNGPIRVERVGRFDNYLTVTDPTVTHPQDPRSRTWEVEASLLADDLESGDVERGRIEVTEE